MLQISFDRYKTYRLYRDTFKRDPELVLTNTSISTVLLDFSLTAKAATLIFISGRGSAISSAKQGKSGFIYNLVKS